MANKPLKTIKFPGLPDTYTVPQVDAVPTQGSTNAVSSGGVYSALADKADKSELPDTDAILDRLDAVETDIEEIYTGKPESVVGTINKLNPETILTNINISKTGTEDTYSGIDSTDYIEVDSTKSSVAFTGLNGALTTRICLLITRLLFYDANKSVLSYIDNVPANTITSVPSGAKYVRMSLRHEFVSARYPMVEFVDDILDDLESEKNDTKANTDKTSNDSKNEKKKNKKKNNNNNKGKGKKKNYTCACNIM